MTREQKARILITLTSGQQLDASLVKLFPESELGVITALRLQAQDKLGGFSAGVAFLGSPGYAIGSAAALSVVESMVSGKRRKDGLALSKQADDRHLDLLKVGRHFPIEEVNHIDIPDPARWLATEYAQEVRLNLKEMGFVERGEVVSKYQISRREVVDGEGIVTVQQDVTFRHDGSEYVWLNVTGREVAVRWSSVGAYEVDGAG